ncbi:Adenylate kinase [Mycoavidus cysteinexigens]|uniref:Adenylate kinase n=1 Tax=Mycoavidus cysteinexigens TaxID=1553431 RepID=A0A2Z6EYC5_9BURK|nr:ATP-binding protein [Mycoavidus cysteinexigens]BBE10125.1 Adenylate kinase [Mycoavidus cysteinexigens]GAM53527.1 hypothetical protein EBME_1990 [bacterium endosymbiont of Mortierella elongata FMR23-6]GLR00541.1 hypothetical protein GCM10007934_03520 [Mycoavidus cysteinexigens]
MLNISTHYPKTPLFPFALDRLAPDLEQARAHNEARPEQANLLYEQVAVSLLELAKQQGLTPSDPDAQITERDQSETPEQTALRQCIAVTYFEHAEVFEKLKQVDQAQAYYQKAIGWGHANALEQLTRLLASSGPRFSLGKLPIRPEPYALREESAQLLELLKDQPKALIEVIGLPGVGKTTLLQRLIQPRPDAFFASYDLLAWIDCSSVNRAHADIQAIGYALGYGNLRPQTALRQVANYVQQHPRSLLILDGLTPSNVDLALTWLKPSFWSGQLIYTTAEPLTDKLKQRLERDVDSLPLSLFTSEQAKDLVQQCLPQEPLDTCDFAQVIRMTEGFPAVIQALCRHYQATILGFKNFADFLAQSEQHQAVRDILLREIAQTTLGPLEAEAVTNPITARALTIIKQAAWLGEPRIPFAFFSHEQVAQDAIQMLSQKQLEMMDIDQATNSLKLNPAFLNVVQKRYLSEQLPLIGKNIQRLFKVFNYLTDNESSDGRHNKPEDLKPYTDLVHTLVFETCAKFSFAKDSPLLHQVLTLGSSLARLYYLHHGELQLAYDCLQAAQRLFKQGLPKEQLAHFEQRPEDFALSIAQQETSQEEALLLKLYAEEYLYQEGTLASQLVPRGQVAVEVIQNFEKSYAIQVNLGPVGNPEAVAYTLRNLTRALRKQGRLVDALERFDELTRWFDRYPAVFNERVRAEILIDQGIIQKELEDARPEAERNYQPAIDALYETHRIFLRHETANQHQALGMLSIYLGEAYLAGGNFEAGMTHTCQILLYDGKRRERQGRAYFNLARAFYEAEYWALAKLFVDQALPIQIGAFQPVTKVLGLKIEQKLLQHQQTVTQDPIDVQTASWETQASLTAYCEAQLIACSVPPKLISRDQIKVVEATAYAWLWQQHAKAVLETEQAVLEAQQAELTQKIAALEVQEKTQEEKRTLQLQQEALWYHTLAQRINLDAPENKHALLFAKQFQEEQLYQMIQLLQRANGEKLLKNKVALAERLIEAVSRALPRIEFNATLGASDTVDLPAIVQAVTKLLSEPHSDQKASAQRIADPEQKSRSLRVCAGIQQQVEEMAYYAARCWQPVFSGQAWHTQDIQTLAEYGARRVMDYLKTGGVDMLSSQERVILALMMGEANARLSQPKADESGRTSPGGRSVQGFFSEPGVKVEAEEPGAGLYLPSQQVRPSVYGYRFGSPLEARTRPYQGVFKSEAEAQQVVEEARNQQKSCLVM